MIWLLRVFFSAVIVVMAIVTIRASLEVPIWNLPTSLTADRWFHATLADAYFGFLTFFAWVAYKETGNVARASWLVAILLLGNFAMAAYALVQLGKVKSDAPLSDVLLRRKEA